MAYYTNICSKDCENKNNIKDDPIYLTICNNCLHSRKKDHYMPKEVMEQSMDDEWPLQTAICPIRKVLNFLSKGQKSI